MIEDTNNTGTVDKTPWLVGSMSRWCVYNMEICPIFIQILTLLKTLFITNILKLYISTLDIYLNSIYIVHSDQWRIWDHFNLKPLIHIKLTVIKYSFQHNHN